MCVWHTKGLANGEGCLGGTQAVVSPEHPSLNVSCLCVACVCVWTWFAVQFMLRDLKIASASTPSAPPLFVLYCMVYYKCVCVGGGGAFSITRANGGRDWYLSRAQSFSGPDR